LEHILKLLKPSYVAVTADKLDVVQKAIDSAKARKPKIFTVLDRVDNLFKVRET
jgi:hypothetical protein